MSTATLDSARSAALRSLSAVLHRPLEPRRAVMGLLVIALNLVDAFGTLANVNRGAEELNPLMSVLLGWGSSPFVVFKHLLASAGVIGILLYPGARAGRIALWILLPLYAAIAVYQVALLGFVA